MSVPARGPEAAAAPRPTLSVVDAVALIVGIVIGAGIFRAPSAVAAHVSDPGVFLLLWFLGGLVSLVGALCYAELATAYPHAGGDYHYLRRAFGPDIAFLFGWARMTVIQTGSIASLAYVFGDYMASLLPLGSHPAALYAASAVLGLTLVNVLGVRPGAWTQNVLTVAKIGGLLAVVLAGTALLGQSPSGAPDVRPPDGALGLALVFVLYTYGGWNEAAYLSAELRDVRRNMVRALVVGVGLITALYVLTNTAYLWGLGLAGVRASDVVAADLLRRVLGPPGATFVSLLIAVAALGGVNGTVWTGARTNYALGRDFSALAFLGRWHARLETPTAALWVQGAIALALVVFGAWTRRGFETMVAYTAPVFWFFFLLTGLALFVLRHREPDVPRPFRVPLYPVTPLVFCTVCLYMLHASLAYAGAGALAGVLVLLTGIPVLVLARRRPSGPCPESGSPEKSLGGGQP
jgi:APA family basic amino acid/polyamine antiporter